MVLSKRELRILFAHWLILSVRLFPFRELTPRGQPNSSEGTAMGRRPAIPECERGLSGCSIGHPLQEANFADEACGYGSRQAKHGTSTPPLFHRRGRRTPLRPRGRTSAHRAVAAIARHQGPGIRLGRTTAALSGLRFAACFAVVVFRFHVNLRVDDAVVRLGITGAR